jgi:hypothetical protein
MKPSDGFRNVGFYDKDGFPISEWKEPSASPIINAEVRPLEQYTLQQETNVENAEVSYQIVFTPMNPMPVTGTIKLIYPPEISPSEGVDTKCLITTDQVYDDKCLFKLDERTTEITGAFDEEFTQPVTILLVNMVNPKDNRPENKGFDLLTYQDTQFQFV